jgi:hypothetical protein
VKVRQPLAEVVIQSDKPFADNLLELLLEELNVRTVRQGALTDDLATSRVEQGMQLGLDLVITDELALAGKARELQRHIQNLRKAKNLKPGQPAHLLVAPQHREVIEPLLAAQPNLTSEAYLVVNDATWQANPENELDLEGQIIFLDLQAEA